MIIDNEIFLEQGDQYVTFEAYVSDWDMDQSGEPWITTAQSSEPTAAGSTPPGRAENQDRETP